MDHKGDPIPLHAYDQLLPRDTSGLLRQALRRARRMDRLIERTLDDLGADAGIPPQEATPQDHERWEAVSDELAESLAYYAAAVERLTAWAREVEEQARDRGRAAKLN